MNVLRNLGFFNKKEPEVEVEVEVEVDSIVPEKEWTLEEVALPGAKLLLEKLESDKLSESERKGFRKKADRLVVMYGEVTPSTPDAEGELEVLDDRFTWLAMQLDKLIGDENGNEKRKR